MGFQVFKSFSHPNLGIVGLHIRTFGADMLPLNKGRNRVILFASEQPGLISSGKRPSL